LTTERFRIDPQEVIHETIEGEVILIALQTGSYYSLEGSGAEIWESLRAGNPPGDIVSALERRYTAEPGEISTAVSALVRELLDERLVHSDVPHDGEVAPPAPVFAGNGREPFVPPVLHKFTDMQDFLLVDPVHEVDDAGWPHTAAAG
jgi:hypothetical protein